MASHVPESLSNRGLRVAWLREYCTFGRWAWEWARALAEEGGEQRRRRRPPPVPALRLQLQLLPQLRLQQLEHELLHCSIAQLVGQVSPGGQRKLRLAWFSLPHCVSGTDDNMSLELTNLH